MNTIEKLRKKIDRIDDTILKALIERAVTAKKIGQVKNKNGTEIYSSAREKEIIMRLSAKKIAPFSAADIEAIYSEIVNACRNLQKKIRIAYFGPEATFTHQVALKYFGRGADYFPQRTISDVFDDVAKQRADYGVVPIENSTEGVVNHTLDMFMESDLKICAEREEPISHFLLSASGDIRRIRKVFTHPQPFGQCRKWLESHLPKADICESASTADAALSASLDGESAAIASELAAKIYRLKIVAARIEDYAENYTRFLVISHNSTAPSGKDKTSILISIKDRVGALNDLLLVFKSNKINLTKIESRPTKKSAWQYIFFVDFEGHAEDPSIKKVLNELKQFCLTVKVLGSYPRS